MLAQFVVAVHDLNRNIERIFTTVLTAAPGQVSLIVVLHNLSSTDKALAHGRVAKLLKQLRLSAELVEVFELDDGIASAAGPKNLGISKARAEWVGLADSDDDIDPGAIAAWLAKGQRLNADVVLPPLRSDDGSLANTPPSSALKTRFYRALDPVKNRLIYRASPVGLFRRDILFENGASFAEGVFTGEDIRFLTRVFFGHRSKSTPLRVMVADPADGAYLILDGALPRVTTTPRPFEVKLAGVCSALSDENMAALSVAQRRCLLLKLLRRDLLELIRGQLNVSWGVSEAGQLRQIVFAIEQNLPVVSYLSRADAAVFKAAMKAGTPPELIKQLLVKSQSYRSVSALVPSRLMLLFSGYGPLRYRLAGRKTVLSVAARYKKYILGAV